MKNGKDVGPRYELTVVAKFKAEQREEGFVLFCYVEEMENIFLLSGGKLGPIETEKFVMI